MDTKIKLYKGTGTDISSVITLISLSDKEVKHKVETRLIPGVYFFKIGNTTSKVYKNQQ